MNIIVVYKKSCIHTRQIYAHIKGVKIGHCGTLDKYAQGVVIVLVGKANKLQNVIHSMKKSYYFEIFFGIDTDTNDIFGTLNYYTHKHINMNNVLHYIKNINITYQNAPKFSAKKVYGKPMYKYKNKDNLPLRISYIQIHNINVVWHNNRKIGIYILVTGGFYVRAFARDIGHFMQTYACVTKIVRITIGPFTLSRAIII